METLVIVVHVLVAIAIIGLILLQQGKGAEMGASFGAGASQTLFGSEGSGNFFSRLTAIIAAVFFITSFALAVIARDKTSVADDVGIPVVEERDVPAVEAPATDVPTVEVPDTSAAEVPTVDSNEQNTAQPETEAEAGTEAEATEIPQPEAQ
jgi:preprotein translocase subunit SecG